MEESYPRATETDHADEDDLEPRVRVDSIRKRSLRGVKARLHGGITMANFVDAHIDSGQSF
jgi:hypothetical protein